MSWRDSVQVLRLRREAGRKEEVGAEGERSWKEGGGGAEGEATQMTEVLRQALFSLLSAIAYLLLGFTIRAECPKGAELFETMSTQECPG